jgi:uncharacterized protein (DUF58 family)
MRGTGIEYSDVREYQPGDDPRSIDWNLSARSDKTYVRESVPDRGADVWLLVDTSRSLDWGTARCLKRQTSLELSAAASHLLARHGNRIGALLFDTRIHTVVRPASGRSALLRLVAMIERGLAVEAGGEATDMTAVLMETAHLVRRPALLIVVSDFLVPDGWEATLGLLSVRHEVVAAWISDPREREIPDVGLVTFEDPETGRQLVVDTSSRALRQRFKDAAEKQRLDVNARLVASGAAVAELSTGEELLPQLLRFFERRLVEARGPRGPRTA